jgi:hypothetical protein
MRGFQFGDPGKPNEIVLELFDAKDRPYEIEILQYRPQGDIPPLSRPQINAIVASMHPLP